MVSRNWKIPYSRLSVPDDFSSITELTPLLSRILVSRGISNADEVREFLESSAGELLPSMSLKDIDKAVDRIRQAAAAHETVAVYGDYDVDGITATCLLTDYLRSIGLRCFHYIPVRTDDGYGLKTIGIDRLREKGVTLIITVDCGITAVEETEYARSKGIDVIITDHHECGAGGIPAAAAVVDCKRADDTYENRYLAGVGIALKLVCACEHDNDEYVDRYCDLVAIGTVADVMPLVGENRILVRRGLAKIHESRIRPGLLAIIRNSKLNPEKLSTSNISFGLAPRLNAAGRIGEAEKAVELLMCQDIDEALRIAQELNELNDKRKKIGDKIWSEAVAKLNGKTPKAPIVLFDDGSEWNQGVIGIVASRLAEKYSIPAILISLEGEDGKGSCRSYGGFNLFNALNSCREHLEGFGGHALAAGLTIKRGSIKSFSEALTRYYYDNPPEESPDLICDLLIDDPELLSAEGIRSLALLEPCGTDNTLPLMCSCDAVICGRASFTGSRKQHAQFKVSIRGRQFDAVLFSYADHCSKDIFRDGMHVDIAYSPRINDYYSRDNVQLTITEIKPHSGIELCTELVNGSNADALYFCREYIPIRQDKIKSKCAVSWRSIRSLNALPGSVNELMEICPDSVTPEMFCVSLLAFMELGLLSQTDGSILSSSPVNNIKVDLQDSHILSGSGRNR